MKITSRDIKSFFYSQYFSDGLRMTFGILAPSLILTQFHHFSQGLMMSLGALCIGTIDSPGPIAHKRNGMAIGNVCLFITAVVTGFARLNTYTLGLEITVFSFFFSMFTVYGNRASSIGTSALLVMILMIDMDAKPPEVLGLSATVLAGGIWYFLFSMIFFGIRPYRQAQQALAESVADVAKFIRIKADFYLPGTDIEENYRKLVSQQVLVSQHQDAVRELLFKSRLLVRESTSTSRVLVLTFVDLVDMYEQIMATNYDYGVIRDQFSGTGIPEHIAKLLQEMAAATDNLAYIVLTNVRPPARPDFLPGLEDIKTQIDEITGEDNASTLALKKILINLRDLNDRIRSIYLYRYSKSKDKFADDSTKADYSRFAPQQDYSPRIFFDNFSLSSGAFKHALRVSLVCLVGYILGRTVAAGHHSYWILLTIVVIMKPGFSLSKQRNLHRLIGTICGGFAGIAILLFIHDKTVQFGLLVFLMLGTYSFLRLNYVTSVIFMTPYILILFNFLGVGLVVKERILDTVIGSAISFIASYLIFPSWEFEKIQYSMAEVTHANAGYLSRIARNMLIRDVGTIEYKLARKDVFVKSANLSAAFDRMTSEPRSKQKNIREVHRFVVLNHILSSYIATVGSSLPGDLSGKYPDIELKRIKRSLRLLNQSSENLGGHAVDLSGLKPAVPTTKPVTIAKDTWLDEQLGLIYKISVDIERMTRHLSE